MAVKAISSRPQSYIPESEQGKLDAFEVIYRPLTYKAAQDWRAGMEIIRKTDGANETMKIIHSERNLWEQQIIEIRNFQFEGKDVPENVGPNMIRRVFEQIPRDIAEAITNEILESGKLSENEIKNSESQSGPVNSQV